LFTLYYRYGNVAFDVRKCAETLRKDGIEAHRYKDYACFDESVSELCKVMLVVTVLIAMP